MQQYYCPPYNNSPYPKHLYNEGTTMSSCPPPQPFMCPYIPNYYKRNRKQKEVESDSEFSVSDSDSESSKYDSNSCSGSRSGVEHKIAQLKNKITILEEKKKRRKYNKDDFDPPDYEKHKFDSADNCSIESKECDSIPFPVKKHKHTCPSEEVKCPSECSSVISSETQSLCSTPKKESVILLRVPKKHKIINNGQQACIRIERTTQI